MGAAESFGGEGLAKKHVYEYKLMERKSTNDYFALFDCCDLLVVFNSILQNFVH
jgi:hypothetical protein